MTTLDPNTTKSIRCLDSPQLAYEPRTRLRRLLPFLMSVFTGLILFVVCHFLFSRNGDLLTGQFLMFLPFFVGMWVAYCLNFHAPTTLGRISKAIVTLLFLIILISIPILKEGTICIVMASPILFVAMWLGAVVLHFFCQKVWRSKALLSIALLPFLAISIPLSEQDNTYTVTDSVVINATTAQVWQTINHVSDIAPNNFYQQSKLLPFMGVPTPKSANTVWQNEQWVRKCEWHGGIKFDEPIVSQVPNQQLRWQFVFYPNSVPKGTLDDHVTLNGEHFKLLLGQYDLTPIDTTHTKLTFTATYRITTNINAYAGFWGKWVMVEFSQDVLNFYKRNLENRG